MHELNSIFGQDGIVFNRHPQLRAAPLGDWRIGEIFEREHVLRVHHESAGVTTVGAPLLELGDLNIPYAGNCTAAMRAYIAKQPARIKGFVAGVIEAIAYIRRRPAESKTILQKYTRVSDPTVLQHAYESDTRYMEALPRPTVEGTKSILENLGVTGRAADQFAAEFNDDQFIRQLVDEGFVKQLYPGGLPPGR